MKRLQDRTAVVTGAASGIGAAIAQALVSAGMRVALVDRDPDLLAAHRLPVDRVATFVADVSDREAMAALPAAVAAKLGPAALLVNNAGVSLAGRFAETSLDDLSWIMNVNFFGAVHACKAFLPQLLAQDEAHIVNVVSAFALAGFAGKTGYCSSKFALRGFSESLAAELLHTKVALTLLYPGPVDTALVRKGRAASAEQRDAEAAFLARRAIPASRVAERTVRAIRRRQARVRLSLDYFFIDWLVRLFPTLSLRLFARASARMPF